MPCTALFENVLLAGWGGGVWGVPAGFLGLGEWQLYCRALETFLRQVATHSILGKNKAVEIFLTNSDVSGQKTNNPPSSHYKRWVYYEDCKERDVTRDILVKL